MAPLPPSSESGQLSNSTLLSSLPIPSPAALIAKRFDILKEAGNAANTVGDKVGEAAGNAPGIAQNVGETVATKAPEIAKTVAENAPDALKDAGKAVADTAKTVAGKAVDLAKQVVDLGFKEMINKWLKSFLKELLRKYWKWLLIPLAVLLYYVGKLIYLWWDATRRQRTANKLYKEYVKAPPSYEFSKILKKRRSKKVVSARIRKWLKSCRRAVWLRLRMWTTGQKKEALEQKDKVKRQLKAHCKELFENEEEGRWYTFRQELFELEKKCVEEAMRADPTATAKRVERETRRKIRGALRSYFRPGRLGGWIPDVTCCGLWDRRRIFNSKIRGLKRLHFCNLMRQIVNVVALADNRRATRKVWELEARLLIKEEAERVKSEKEALGMANNLEKAEKSNGSSGETFVEKRWSHQSTDTAVEPTQNTETDSEKTTK